MSGCSQARPSSVRASKTWLTTEKQSLRAWRCSRCQRHSGAACGPDWSRQWPAPRPQSPLSSKCPMGRQ
eukprot:15454926-Alexandrium_andersonii.AAC.1